MTYTQEQIDAIRAQNYRIHSARMDLECDLRNVLNLPKYNLLSNDMKADVLLELENDGEYDPEG